MDFLLHHSSSYCSVPLQVSAVQRKFVEKLLTFSIFSKHLTAVREINNMLRRCLDLRETSLDDDSESAIKVSIVCTKSNFALQDCWSEKACEPEYDMRAFPRVACSFSQDAMRWLLENDLVKALLRAHLHQRQYVDQVQKVLKILAAEGGLQADHLELLWNLTEQVCVIEQAWGT
jgi:hypothetical protein